MEEEVQLCDKFGGYGVRVKPSTIHHEDTCVLSFSSKHFVKGEAIVYK